MLYAAAQIILRIWLRLFIGWRVEGRENVIPEGPVVIVSNHRHWADPLCLGAAFRRPIHYMSKKELFAKPLAGAILRKVGAVPVDRESGGNVNMLKTMMSLLRNNEVIGVFPEGTRSLGSGLKPFKDGAFVIAERAGAFLQPVALENTERFLHPFRREKLVVRILPPISMQDAEKGRKERVSAGLDASWQAIFAALTERKNS